MSNSKKPLAVLSMSAVAGLLAIAVTTPVSAKATAIAVNGTDSKVYEYNYTDLKTSAVAAVTNDTTGAKLYNDFLTRKASIKAYYDDVQKSYVDFSVVSAAATDAVINQKTFDFNTFLQTAATETLATNKVAVDASGNVTVTSPDPSKDVTSVSAITATTNIGPVATLPTTANVTLGDGTTKAVTITWSAAATTASTYATAGTVTVSGTLADYDNYAVSATVTVNGVLGVQSVNVINAKQIQVTFNKAIDVKSVVANPGTDDTLVDGVLSITRVPAAISPDTAKNITADSAIGELSADGKVLTITPQTTEYLDGSYVLSVVDKKIATKDGEKLGAYTTTLSVKDTVAPSVKGVQYNVASGNVELTLTEPIAAKPTVVRIGDTPVAASAISLDKNNTVVKVAAASLIKAGASATVYAVGAVDYASNNLVAFNGTVTRPADTNALSVASLTQVGSNKVRLVFNKALVGGNAIGATKTTQETAVQSALSVIKDGTTYTNGSPVAFTVTRNDDVDANGLTFDVAVELTAAGSPNFGIYDVDSNTKDITVALVKDALTDVYGNTNAALTKTITLTKDQVAPKLVSSKLSDDKTKFLLTFDKELSSTITTANVIVRKDGVAYTAGTPALSSSDAKVLEVPNTGSPAIAYAAGTYTIRLDAKAVKDLAGNANDIISTNVTVADENTTAKLNVTATSSTANTFVLSFKDNATSPAAVNVKDDALNASHYTLDGKALPTGTDIYFSGSTTGLEKSEITITLPDNSINMGSTSTPASALLLASGISDNNGNTIKDTQMTVNVKDNTPATLKSASLTGDTLILTFDENVDATAVTDIDTLLADLQIKAGTVTFAKTIVGSGSTAASAAVSASGKTITVVVTGADSNWSTVKSASAITITTLDGSTVDGVVTNLKDADGAGVKSDIKVNVTK